MHISEVRKHELPIKLPLVSVSEINVHMQKLIYTMSNSNTEIVVEDAEEEKGEH